MSPDNVFRFSHSIFCGVQADEISINDAHVTVRKSSVWINTNITIADSIFTSRTWDQTAILREHPTQAKMSDRGVAVCSAKPVRSFLSTILLTGPERNRDLPLCSRDVLVVVSPIVDD